jgi:hypothetical protein
VTPNSDGAEASAAAAEEEEDGAEGRKEAVTGAPPGGQPWTEGGTAIRAQKRETRTEGTEDKGERGLPKHKPLQTANRS